MAETGEVPDDLHYTKDHEWVRIDGDLAVVGITDHAQDALGDITYVELPQVGKKFNQFDELAVVESAKAASDIYAPLTGTVAEVNGDLEDEPQKVNDSPYEEGWICRLKKFDEAELENLLTAEEYRKVLEEEG